MLSSYEQKGCGGVIHAWVLIYYVAHCVSTVFAGIYVVPEYVAVDAINLLGTAVHCWFSWT